MSPGPPLHELRTVQIPLEVAQWSCIAGVGIVVTSILAEPLKSIGYAAGAVALVGMIALIGLRSSNQDVLPVVMLGYSTLAISCRCLEGFAIGSSVRPIFRWWHLPALIVLLVGLYVGLVQLEQNALAFAKIGWTMAGTAWASWSLALTCHRNSNGNFGPLAGLGFFVVFFSSTVQVQASSGIELVVFHAVVPIGIALGIALGAKPSATSPEPATARPPTAD